MHRHRLLTVAVIGILIAVFVPCSGMGQTNSDQGGQAPVIIYGSTTVAPNWIPPIWRLPITIAVTNLESATVSIRDVNLGTVRINGTLVPSNTAIVVEAQEPACWTLRLITDVQSLGNTYVDRHDPVEQPYVVSGKLNNGADFMAEGTLAFYALRAGDVDNSGNTDISDLRQIVDYLFKGSPRPKGLVNGDMDRDSAVDLTDLTHLLDWLF